jgi:membrane protein
LKRIRLVISGSISEWISQRAASKGAALSFYILFSMAPILLLVTAAGGIATAVAILFPTLLARPRHLQR